MFRFELLRNMAFFMTRLFSTLFESKKQLDSFLIINFYSLLLYFQFSNCSPGNVDGKAASQYFALHEVTQN